MGGELIRRGHGRIHKMSEDTLRHITQRAARTGKKRKSDPVVRKMKGWEEQKTKQFPAEHGETPGFVQAGALKSSRLVKLGDAIKNKKGKSRVPEMGPDAEKKAVAALNRFGEQEIEPERLSELLHGRGVPTIEELGSIYIAIRKSRSADAQYCLFRILQEAVKHGTRRMRKAADQCLDALLEQGVKDYRKLE